MKMRVGLIGTVVALLASSCTILAWGSNEYGQLGDGTSGTNVLSPAAIAGTEWAVVDTDANHTCAVKSDNTMWCWGRNNGGQLGDGTTTDRVTPVQVGTATGWTKVATGRYHTCGIRSRQMWCWGNNNNGQIGDGTTTARLSPVRAGTASDWVSVAAGSKHTCAIRDGNRGYCWGRNNSGQLGVGDTTDRSAPTLIVDQPWTQIDAGTGHTCGIQDSAHRWLSCWGSNSAVQLGSNLSWPGPGPAGVTSPLPVNTGPYSSVQFRATAVTTGSSHTCAISSEPDTAGRIFCWGGYSSGQLGLGTELEIGGRCYFQDGVVVPCEIEDGFTDWTSLDAGARTTCAIRRQEIWCWGANDNGQVGRGNTVDFWEPAQVTIPDGYLQVRTGPSTIATRYDG